MDCFRQISRCIKAPFSRNRGKVLEIGPPTNFRKEELPACFSDAESVLSPSPNHTERPILTNPSQHRDVSGQLWSNGKERGHNRDSGPSNDNQGETSEPCSEDERETVESRLRESVSPPRCFGSTPTPVLSHETEATYELELVTTAEKEQSEASLI